MASPNQPDAKSNQKTPAQKTPAAKSESSITPRSVSYSDWYLDVIRQAELAEDVYKRQPLPLTESRKVTG